MRTKRTIGVISAVGLIFPLSSWLIARTGHTGFMVLDLVASLLILGLLAYAAFRERTTADKSERLSSKAATMILCSLGLWVVFVFFRAMAH